MKGILIKTYTGHGYEVRDLDVLEDNSQIASCGKDRQTFLWDVATGKCIRKFSGHQTRTNCITFNEQCSVLVTGGYDKHVKIWDCKSRNYDPIQILSDAQDSITSIAVSKYEIVSASVDGKIRNYDLRMARLRTDSFNRPCTSVNLSNDGNCVLVSCLDSHIRLIDKGEGDLLAEYTGHKNTEYPIASNLTNTDAYVVSGSEDHKIYFWDLVEGSIVHSLSGHSKTVSAVAVHPE
eukprot:CAMPEP_0174259152 /NCGR_PEP_ID=MMETSP0439-20130205/8028_1 /TAXON_ID=0 /ORGANISM="Stereomyxa ramosa, Strain Chinc5" /LENGTH=234 /DNA_ID=CAMNT_0015342943 /DNA_START=112 /DNA_END=813 /DNA_ORIENTATION=-